MSDAAKNFFTSIYGIVLFELAYTDIFNTLEVIEDTLMVETNEELCHDVYSYLVGAGLISNVSFGDIETAYNYVNDQRKLRAVWKEKNRMEKEERRKLEEVKKDAIIVAKNTPIDYNAKKEDILKHATLKFSFEISTIANSQSLSDSTECEREEYAIAWNKIKKAGFVVVCGRLQIAQ